MHARLGLLSIVTALALLGCDFFKELESEPDAGETDDDDDDEADDTEGTAGDETEGEPCTVLDEHCEDQDTLVTCDPESGELVTADCSQLCAGLLNFTCTPTDTFQHACWCVSPGEFKIDSCTQLETCVTECGDPNSSCAASCFESTDATTIRLLGALWSCADLSCDELCSESPTDCSSCLAAARAGLWGDCGVERSVCDSDKGDEPWP